MSQRAIDCRDFLFQKNSWSVKNDHTEQERTPYITFALCVVPAMIVSWHWGPERWVSRLQITTIQRSSTEKFATEMTSIKLLQHTQSGPIVQG